MSAFYRIQGFYLTSTICGGSIAALFAPSSVLAYSPSTPGRAPCEARVARPREDPRRDLEAAPHFLEEKLQAHHRSARCVGTKDR